MSKKSNKPDNSKRQQPVQQQRAQAAQSRKAKPAKPGAGVKKAEEGSTPESPPKH